jgi:hypothetical protein
MKFLIMQLPAMKTYDGGDDDTSRFASCHTFCAHLKLRVSEAADPEESLPWSRYTSCITQINKQSISNYRETGDGLKTINSFSLTSYLCLGELRLHSGGALGGSRSPEFRLLQLRRNGLGLLLQLGELVYEVCA